MLTSRSNGGRRATSSPPSSTRPWSGSSKPAIRRSVVVLPEPEGPSIVKNSPWPTSRSMRSTATKSPKRFSRSTRRMSGTPSAAVAAAPPLTCRLVAARHRMLPLDAASNCRPNIKQTGGALQWRGGAICGPALSNPVGTPRVTPKSGSDGPSESGTPRRMKQHEPQDRNHRRRRCASAWICSTPSSPPPARPTLARTARTCATCATSSTRSTRPGDGDGDGDRVSARARHRRPAATADARRASAHADQPPGQSSPSPCQRHRPALGERRLAIA